MGLSDKGLGAVMLVGAIIALVVYLLAMFFPLWGGIGGFAWYIAITVVAVLAVGAVCVIIGWVGYTLLTTPAPTPPSVSEEEITGLKSEEGKEEGKS